MALGHWMHGKDSFLVLIGHRYHKSEGSAAYMEEKFLFFTVFIHFSYQCLLVVTVHETETRVFCANILNK